MKSDRTYYLISPEVLKSDIIQETYSGNTFGVYSGMSEILSGGTNGSSLLTGLTIPIVFTDTFNDLGYYTPFDGYILQKDVVNNFTYWATLHHHLRYLFLILLIKILRNFYSWLIMLLIGGMEVLLKKLIVFHKLLITYLSISIRFYHHHHTDKSMGCNRGKKENHGPYDECYYYKP